jgi:hypothetical protein
MYSTPGSSISMQFVGNSGDPDMLRLYGTSKLITTFTEPATVYPVLYQISYVHTFICYLRPILILSPHLPLELPSGPLL